MKSKLLTLFIILFSLKCFSQANAAKQVSIDSRYIEVNKRFLSSVGINANFPIGDWQDFIGMGAGIFYEGRWLASNYISIYGNAGYNYFTGDPYDGIHQLYFIPGARFNIVGNFYTYLGGGISYAAIDRDDQTGFAYEAGFGIDFISSKKYPLRNVIPVLGIKGGVMSFKYGEDFNESIGLKFIMTFTNAVKGK